MALPFDETIPRHWMHDNVLATHLTNGLNLLFPAGERFFVRSVRYYLDELDDDELAESVRGFFGQEGLHAREHERFFAILRAQGYDVDGFLGWYERVGYELLEPRFSPQIRLAVTAACEHFTAMFAENALGTDMLDGVHPAMQRLLRWHAAEEIEHKAVAFDVLTRVNPSYALRIGGLAFATCVLVGFWLGGTVTLMRQEAPRPWRKRLRDGWEMLTRSPAPNMARSFVRYLRPGFHPDDIDNDALALGYLAQIGRADG
jgi:predicted metal-dependent hydrolase